MTPLAASKKPIEFDTKTFLSTISGGRRIEDFPRKGTIFAQGDSSDGVFYIQKGKVKLTVVSEIGKEATMGILNEGDFFGEGCLAGQPLRLCSATAMTDCSVMKIDSKFMIEVLHREHAFSDMFVAYLQARNIRYEADLVDQFFNSNELGNETSLWTAWRVAHLIERECGVKYNPPLAWRILRQLCWSSHRLVGRGLERDEDKIRRWKRESWPGIKKKPKKRTALSSSSRKAD
jgi:hypothetical protein